MDDQITNAAQHLAHNVAVLRNKRNLSQQQLAVAADIPRSTIANLELGSGNPSLKTLLHIAGALRVSIEELLAKPRVECLLLKSHQLPTSKRSQGDVVVQQLLPDPITGLQIEKLEIQPGAMLRGTPHSSGTKEYFSCTAGVITVLVDGTAYTVESGDLLAFPGDQRHTYQNKIEKISTGISVLAFAPRFL